MQVPTKGIVDIAAIAVPVVTAITQFMQDKHSYEVIFLSVAFLALYGYLRTQQSRVDELKTVIASLTSRYEAEMKAMKDRHEADFTLMRNTYETDLRLLRTQHDRYTRASNATVANLFSDVSSFAGERRIGQLTVDPESGAMLYQKAGEPIPPAGVDRRGVSSRSPEPTTHYQGGAE